VAIVYYREPHQLEAQMHHALGDWLTTLLPGVQLTALAADVRDWLTAKISQCQSFISVVASVSTN